MKKSIRNIVFLGFVLILPSLAVCQPREVLTFFDGETIHLRWNGIRADDVNGYLVYRQTGNSNTWEILTPQPLQLITNRDSIKARVGFKHAVFMQLFGIQDDSSDLTLNTYRNFLANSQAVSFMGVMSLINSEFAELLGEMYHDHNIIPGYSYRYKIEVLQGNDSRDLVITPWISTTQTDSVPPVEGLSGLGLDQNILLSWDKQPQLMENGDVVTYRIYRSGNILGPFTQRNTFGILPVTVTTSDEQTRSDQEQFVDNYLANGDTYHYFINAVNAFGIESRRSITVSVTAGADIKPKPPLNLTVNYTGNNLKLEWDTPGNPIDGFEVYRSVIPVSGFTKVHPLSDLVRSKRNFYLDLDVNEGSSYYYYVNSIQNDLTSEPSDTIEFKIPDQTPPDPPQNIQASPATGGIRIIWDPNTEPDIAGYEIERTSDTSFQKAFLLNSKLISSTEYIDSIPAVSQTIYGYLLYAYDNSYNRSTPSELVKVRMPDIVPPQRPFITGLDRNGNQVNMTWTKSIDPEINEYRVYQAKDDGDWILAGSTNDLTYTFTLTESGDYRFAVSAVDAAGNESDRSTLYKLSYDVNVFPEPPTRFRARNTRDGDVLLTWESSTTPNVTGYMISRINNDTGSSIDLRQAGADQVEFTDKSIRSGKTYTYKIRAYNAVYKMSRSISAEIKIR